MLDIVAILAVFSVLLVLVALSQPIAAQLRLAPVVLLAVIGASISAAAGVLLHYHLSPRVEGVVGLLVNLPLSSEAFIYVFLPLLIFEAALTSDVRRILEDAAPILMLAVIATLVAMGIVGLALWPFSGMPLVVCLLLGAVVSTTDPAAVIAIFRDVGAAARLTRLVEGESLLNDAAAIVAYTVLLGMIVSGRDFHLGQGATAFFFSFGGGGIVGLISGRLLLQLIPWTRDDRLAEATLTVALAYLSYIVADHVFHVSGVVAVLLAGLTVSYFGRARITPNNWSFITELWEQLAYWAHSLVFLLASILVPKLLFDLQLRDFMLLLVLLVAAFASRLAVLFLLLPLLSRARLTEPISTAYKLAIAWGGLRGALTLVLAFSLTENPAVSKDVQHFVTVLATGIVMFTLLVNGTTLRWVIRVLGLDRLSPVDRALRDRVLELTYAETGDIIRKTAREHDLHPSAEARALAPYQAWSKSAPDRVSIGGAGLTERERLAVSLVALGSQERMLVLEMLARRAASPGAVQALMRNAEALVEGARSDGRLGYKRAVEDALAFPFAFRLSYWLYRRLGLRGFLADQLGDRFETLLVTRLLIQDLAGDSARRSRSIFGQRVEGLIDHILKERLDRTKSGLAALRRQYPDYAAALEARFLRQSALRREAGRYKALYEEGLIAPEVYRDLSMGVEGAREAEAAPRFDIGLDLRDLITRLDFFADLDPQHLARVQRMMRTRFMVPNELIVRKGERGGRGLLHSLRRGRSYPAGPAHPAGQRRRVRRNGADYRRTPAGGREGPDLLPAGRPAQGGFRPLHPRQPDVRSRMNAIAEKRYSANLSETAAAS